MKKKEKLQIFIQNQQKFAINKKFSSK